MLTKHPSSRNQFLERGFTVVELIVVMVVMGIMVVIVFGPIDALYSSSIKTLGTTVQNTDNREAIRFLQREIGQSRAFLSTSDASINTGSASWNFKGSSATDNVLITDRLATVGTGNDSALAYTPKGITGCNAQASQNDILHIQYIYYVKDHNLYRRTDVPNKTVCGSQPLAQKQTCRTTTDNSGYVAPTPLTCNGTDALLLTDVSEFRVDYYGSSVDTTALNNVYNNPSSLTPSVSTVTIALKTNRSINGTKTDLTTSIRVTHSD